MQTPNGTPFRLFFSSAAIDNDFASATWRSPAFLLKNSKLRPTDAAGYYYYEMYMTHFIVKDYTPFGSILFGRDDSGNTVVTWDSTRWTKV